MGANQHRLKQQLAAHGISMEEWRENIYIYIYPDFKNGEPQIPEKKPAASEQDTNLDIGSFTI